MIPFRSPHWLRSGMAGCVLATASLGAWQQTRAQAIAGLKSDAPVNYAADRIELQDKQNRVILSGNVDITQADMRLRAARTTVIFTRNPDLKIQRMDATGGVTVTRGTESARGNVAVYDFNKRIITMVGNVALRRGNDTLNGGRLVINLATGVSTVDRRAGGSSGSGRVSGSFSVPRNSTTGN